MNIEIGTEAEYVPEHWLLYNWLAFHGLLNQLSYITQGHLTKDDTTTNGLYIPTSTINKENAAVKSSPTAHQTEDCSS